MQWLKEKGQRMKKGHEQVGALKQSLAKCPRSLQL
jgi:hypothetical protein